MPCSAGDGCLGLCWATEDRRNNAACGVAGVLASENGLDRRLLIADAATLIADAATLIADAATLRRYDASKVRLKV